MPLNFIFTIDGDWDEYFYAARPQEQRLPDKRTLLELLDRQLTLIADNGGKSVHFVHTSPLARNFFLQPEFLALWKRLEARGGNIGIHCHEEELYTAWHYADTARMTPAIDGLVQGLRNAGLSPRAYRGGFMTFCAALIPLLEKHGIKLDFSCDPGRHMVKNGALVSDWRGAPDNVYRMDERDHRKTGKSSVYEIPLGVYIEQQSLLRIWQTCRTLKKRREEIIVAVLAHTYDFASWKMRLKIRAALLICRLHGNFIGVEQALEKIRGMGL